MRHLKIVADDLTGAADAAARCRRFGVPATIYLDAPTQPVPQGAVAVSSDSRHLAAEAAAKQARSTAASLLDLDGGWYKKIDSTLRGNIGSELDALLELLDVPAAVVCPAFPSQGRRMRDGTLTAPDAGPPGIHLPSLLREQSRLPVAELTLAQVRGGELGTDLRQAARERANRGAQGRIVFAVDALTDDDLDRVVRAQQEALPEALLCGSSGLAGALVRQSGGLKGFQAVPERYAGSAGRSVVLVAGSGSAVSHRQIDSLLSYGRDAPDWGVSRLVVAPTMDGRETAALAPASPIWLLQQARPLPGAVLEGREARRRADHLAQVSMAAMARRRVDLIMLVGGDTAMRMLRHLGAARLTVERELLPGIPLCSAVLEGRPTLVVIKPGRFGGDGTLVELLDRVGMPGGGNGKG